VVPRVAGSSPVSHPFFFIRDHLIFVACDLRSFFMPRSRRALASSRRTFLSASSAVAAGYFVAPMVRAEDAPPPTSANEELRFACIGIGGKGQSDSADAGRSGKVVAVADVDSNQLKRGAKSFPEAKAYTDFRKMLDAMAREIDAVTISTPDHTHITAATMALGLGKHCFCQKPLTRSIAEARLLSDLARSKGVTAHNIATAWVLAQSFPSLALIGPRSPGEIASTLPALGLTLTPAEVAWLNLEAETSA